MSETPASAPPRNRRLVLPAAALAAVLVAGGGYALWRVDRRAKTQLGEVDRMLGPQRTAWRAEKDGEMKGELSPLGRVDYIHLPLGEALVGGPALPLPAGAFDSSKAAVRLITGGGKVALQASPAVPVGGTPKEQADLQAGDVVALGRARLLVTGLPADPSVAVYDLEAPAKRAYRGLRYYPDDSRYTTVGQLERYGEPRKVQVEASRGGPQQMNALGVVRFELGDAACELEAYGSGPGMLFLIFKDETNGKPGGSYGAGRFLYARIAPGEKVLLDFNQAWNPLCAYSAYFHCPLPPRRNWLKLPVPAGERAYGEH
jgi:uncharacterized protein (DUF1684 family)